MFRPDDRLDYWFIFAMHNRMQGEQQQQRIELALPPGFRFFPTDEELITCYLARKAMDGSFTTAAIRDVDLYKTEPWDLPCTLQLECDRAACYISMQAAV